MCILFGFYMMTVLNDLDIQNDPDCDSDGKDDFCADETLSYQGKYHIAYRFRTDKYIYQKLCIYFMLMFIPPLLVGPFGSGLAWPMFIGLIYALCRKLGFGEFAAIWCFASVIYLPIAIFEETFSLK
tara:strand:- start:5140 stop:5520 length:381 start_codon:yes stop_codon:yes gene_type:complete